MEMLVELWPAIMIVGAVIALGVWAYWPIVKRKAA